jgi:peptidoglycan hydrolase-like protein with peptidoglycan-binding domain
MSGAMNRKSGSQAKSTTPPPAFSLSMPGILQRKCDCGGVAGLTGQCEECSGKRLSGQGRVSNPPPGGDEVSQIAAVTATEQLPGHSFGRMSVQAKFEIGQPGDKYEQEADRVAEQVMRMPEPKIQRICPECEEELQRQPMEEEENKKEEATLQTKPLAGPITPLIQRQTEPMKEEDKKKEEPNDQGDLTNPRFKGDPELEDCYDHQRLFRQGSRGNAVAKIQSGISDYFTAKGEEDPLPVYGADGEFGSETRRAVVKFQDSVGFTGEEVDGVIGHDTMEKLDKEVPDKPKPEPEDPDEKCLKCKPIAKITKKDKNTTTVFGLCSDKFDVFNTGAGTPGIGPGCLPQKSNTKGVVNFRSGTESSPAWQTTADIKDCTTPPPTANSTTPWEIGFIQTLESATFGASYDNNNFVSVSNKNARDALTDNKVKVQVPAPWMDHKGNLIGPQDYPTVPMINDTPNVSFNITHPDTAKDFLRSVCMKAKFNIWLIINRKGVTPTASNVDFFYHWSIDIDQSYSLSGAGVHPCNKSQWSATGSQSMSNKGPGKGSATLVWDQPIAKQSKVTDTKLKTSPCA